MESPAQKVKSLAQQFRLVLEQEQKFLRESMARLQESLRLLQEDTADRRFQALALQLRKIHDHLDDLCDRGPKDFLEPMIHEGEGLTKECEQARFSAVIEGCLGVDTPSLSEVCAALFDSLVSTMNAERGFLIFYDAESTEAELVATRNFQSTDLASGEYQFSRSLLREVWRTNRPLLLEDASQHPTFSQQSSVVSLKLRAVLAAPLIDGGRTLGAIYLENNRVPHAFEESDVQLLSRVARFMVFYLHQTHRLPFTTKSSRRVVLDQTRASKEIVGRSAAITKLLKTIDQLAESPATVLIEGESGTGKELVARALHYQSSRKKYPFVAINCAAIPENLLESELFGHEKGAFTGATERYIGRIEQGDHGTVFLDEISELAPSLQAKLLRFLQSNEFDRLGGKERIHADVRVIAATGKNLKEGIAAGRFLDSLFYRLNVLPLRLPPLKERREDIPMLIEHFREKFSVVYRKPVQFDPAISACLMDYPFPGNVRELENLVHRMIALAPDSYLRFADLPPEYLHAASQRISLAEEPLLEVLHRSPANLEELRRLKSRLDQLLRKRQKDLIQRAIQESNGNLTQAAQRLGMHRITLHRILRKPPEV
ncbi:MAG: sigma-54-dependent Fis family transcriptional regulator [Acidobacteriia bacterium]|nr:sigma-54-dependent Fis family transcriptional regulator [Terriglobia bacterium]